MKQARIFFLPGMHRLHRFPLVLYHAAAHLSIDQLTLKSRPLVFKSKTSFDSSVSLAYFLSLKDFVWLRKRSLKVFAVIPMYTAKNSTSCYGSVG